LCGKYHSLNLYKNMRKIILALGLFFILLIILFGLAFLNLNFFINKNKAFFVSQLEKSLGRKISVGEIKTGFRDGLGIRLKNFSLADDKKFSETAFIRASDVQVNVEFIPLLSKKINISKLILNNPVINIVKNKKGKYNFSEIIAGNQSRPDKTTEKSKAEGEPALFASSILIKQGQINYEDLSSESVFQIQKINIGINDFGYNNKFPLDIEAALFSSEPNIKISGVFGPVASDQDLLEMPVTGRLKIIDLDINTLKKFIPAIRINIPEGLDISGPLNANVKYSGSLDALKLNDINMNASVFGSRGPNLELSGNIGPLGENSKNLSLNTEFSLKNANLSKLRNFAFLKGSFPNRLSTQGTVDISGKSKGTLDDLKFTSVKLDATNSRLAVIGNFLKPKNTPFVITAEGRISNTIIELSNMNVVINTLRLDSKGKINRGTTNLIDIAVTSNKIDLADLSETFPSIEEYKPSGWLQLLNTNLKGELGKGQVPDIKGSLLISEASITPKSFPEPVSRINTRINFSGKTAAIKDMSLNVGKSSLQLSANIDNLSPLVLRYEVRSPEFYISDVNKNRLAAHREEIIRNLKSKGEVSTKHGNLAMKGSLSSSRATIADFELQDLEAEFSLLDETIQIENFQTKAYEALIKGNANYKMGADSQFSAISDIRGFDLKSFLDSRNSDNTQKIRGKANLDINIFGSGGGWDEIKESLKGTAKAEILDGAVMDVNVADNVLKQITGVPGLTFLVSPAMKDKYPQAFKTQDTEFKEFRSLFVLENGKMETNDLKIRSKDYSINGTGWINFDGKVDLQSQLIFSKEFSDDLETDIPDIKYLKNDSRVEIPFRITGTLPNARAKPDIPYLAKQVQRTGIRSVIEELTSESEESNDKNPQVEASPAPIKKKKRLDEKIVDELKDIF